MKFEKAVASLLYAAKKGAKTDNQKQAIELLEPHLTRKNAGILQLHTPVKAVKLDADKYAEGPLGWNDRMRKIEGEVGYVKKLAAIDPIDEDCEVIVTVVYPEREWHFHFFIEDLEVALGEESGRETDDAEIEPEVSLAING